MIVLLEGPAGTGKSTVSWILKDLIPGSICVRDPDYYRNLLLSNNSKISDRTRFYLYMAAREELLDKQIRPALEEGKTVICDRLHLSTIVHQGFVKGIPLSEIAGISATMLKGLNIRTFLMDCSVHTTMERKAGDDEGYWEQGGLLTKIRQGYAKLAKMYKYPVMDSDLLTAEEIADGIKKLL